VERLHRRVAPKKPLWRLMGGRPQRRAIGHGEEKQRVRRQQIFGGRNCRAG